MNTPTDDRRDAYLADYLVNVNARLATCTDARLDLEDASAFLDRGFDARTAAEVFLAELADVSLEDYLEAEHRARVADARAAFDRELARQDAERDARRAADPDLAAIVAHAAYDSLDAYVSQVNALLPPAARVLTRDDLRATFEDGQLDADAAARMIRTGRAEDFRHLSDAHLAYEDAGTSNLAPLIAAAFRDAYPTLASYASQVDVYLAEHTSLTASDFDLTDAYARCDDPSEAAMGIIGELADADLDVHNARTAREDADALAHLDLAAVHASADAYTRPAPLASFADRHPAVAAYLRNA